MRSCGIPDAPSAAGTRSHPGRPPRRFAARGVMNAATTEGTGVMNAATTHFCNSLAGALLLLYGRDEKCYNHILYHNIYCSS